VQGPELAFGFILGDMVMQDLGLGRAITVRSFGSSKELGDWKRDRPSSRQTLHNIPRRKKAHAWASQRRAWGSHHLPSSSIAM
jgi:hypothetical protein